MGYRESQRHLKIMILKHGDKDLMDPGLLDDCQLAEWED